MGVKDLFPTLRKLVPRAIQPIDQLPLNAKFAIDGNLLTTKFHFSPGQINSNRHVKNWYNFLTDLEKRGIEAVVVFDGEGRKTEKERERQRRRDARELQRQRGVAEGSRTQRLMGVKELWEGEKPKVKFEDEAAVQNDEEETVELQEWTRVRGRELWKLMDEYEKDKTNRIYSQNQALLTKEEGNFYASILEHILPHAPNPPDPVQSETTPLPQLSREDTVDFPVPSTADSPISQPPPSTDSSSPPSPSPPSSLSTSSGKDTENVVENQLDPTTAAEQAFSTLAPNLDEIPPTYPAAPSPPREEISPPESIVEPDLDSLIRKSAALSKSHLSRSVSVPSHVFEDVKLLISSMGYPILTPSSHNPFEAEAICSLLYHMSSLTGVTHVVSEDTDVLVYSAPLLRRITTSEVGAQERLKKKKGFEMSITDPEVVREGLGLSEKEFVDWCLLCGTDFTERVPLLGPSTAFKLMKKYRSIENIFANEPLRKKYFPPSPLPASTIAVRNDDGEDLDSIGSFDEWMARINAARRIFLELPDLEDVVLEGEAINFRGQPESVSLQSAQDDKIMDLHDEGGEDRTQSESGIKSEWFSKKPEKKAELEKFRRIFGINGRAAETSSWAYDVELADEDWEEMFEGDDEFSNEQIAFERFQEEDWTRELDSRAAEVWLKEHEVEV